jgi:alkaline phosphatase D
MKHSSLLLWPLFLCLSCTVPQSKRVTYGDPVHSLYDSTLKPFYHGVASGDPLNDRVIIWTRVTPEDSVNSIPVVWEIAETNTFNSIYKTDSARALAQKDFTIKVDVNGLLPGKTYYYRFKALNKTSLVGRTKTIAASSADSLKLAVVSCANWEWGYFNPYDKIADHLDIDAVVHLGDYLYEYGTGSYGDTSLHRIHIPKNELLTLRDYRSRHSQYRTDVGLRRVSQTHPMIAIWDDHEVANDSYAMGAQNHQPHEGAYEDRKAAAKKAYYEWLPIRENKKHYRSFSFGTLADLIMLDERLEGRTKPVDSLGDPNYQSPDRTMLGKEQLAWLQTNLNNSKSIWKIIGNQVMFSDVVQTPIFRKVSRNLDSWDGYPAEKKTIKDFIVNNKISNVLLVTGDTHASWAIEAATNVSQSYQPFAIELGTTSISSANENERNPDEKVKQMEASIRAANPHVKFFNARDHGYLLLSLYPTRAKAQWYFVESLARQPVNEFLAKTYEIERGKNKLITK